MSSESLTPQTKENIKKGAVIASLASNARQYEIVGALVVIIIVFEISTGGLLLQPNTIVH